MRIPALVIILVLIGILSSNCTFRNTTGIPTDAIALTTEEAGYIMNFLTDFLVFSEEGKLGMPDRGFPKQFYLYDKDTVISLGEMLSLFFQLQSYEAKATKQPFFIPKQQVFSFVDSASNPQEAYELSLQGKIPKRIAGETLQNYTYKMLVGENVNYNYKIPDLNIKEKVIKISFTFDIESGRYVSDASGITISPCKDDNYSLGLEEDEKVCDNPSYMAWMSPRDNKIIYTQYPYPQVSGILGFNVILNYSERYGIPITNFIVKKDIVAFNILDKELVDRARLLVKKGLFEVGSHTRYHTHLGFVDEELAKKELKESKLFLEEFFNTTVFGFRAPYLSILNDDDMHVKALLEANYSYSSDSIKYVGKVPGHDFFNKPWNTKKYTAYMSPNEFREMMVEKEYIITLDHPWNMAYQDGNILVEEPNLIDNHRAIVLTAISNGGIPVLLRDLNLSKS